MEDGDEHSNELLQRQPTHFAIDHDDRWDEVIWWMREFDRTLVKAQWEELVAEVEDP